MTLLATRTVPAPFVVSPTWSFDGDDGNWTTFSVNVGSPPQSFRMLPSTSGSETWVPIPEGCQGVLSGITDCGTLRGVNDYNGVPSAGFHSNDSSTWSTIGIYQLTSEQSLFNTNTGLYGLDTISLAPEITTNTSPNVTSQTIAGVATADFWLGSIGLGTASASFTTRNSDIPSLLSTLKNQSIIPSLSYGYTAGSPYSSNRTPGSLILGGYDQARFTPNDMAFPIGGAQNQSLGVSIESIIATNIFGGTLATLQGGSINAAIDSAVSQLWLPQEVCDLFAQAFGLTYDSTTDLYLVNSSIHTQLLQMKPSVTFTLSASGSDISNLTTNIVMPYAAFDLRADIPIYNFSTPYFPLRVAANESQQVLGRAFLQEAYVVVDWESNNFTLGQAIHQNSTSNIIPILPPTTHSSSSGSGTSDHTGAIAGGVVGAVGGVALLVGLILFCLIRKRRQQRSAAASAAKEQLLEDQKAIELHGDEVNPSEIMSTQVHELDEGESPRKEAMSTPITELPGHNLERELDGTSAGTTPRPGDGNYLDDMAKRGVGHVADEPTLAERHELP